MLKEIESIYLHSRCWYLSHEYLFLFYFILFYYQKVGIHALAQAQKLLSFFPSKYFLKKQNRKPSTDNLELEMFKSMMISTYGRLTANVEQLRYRENKSILFCFPRKRERESILFCMSIIRAPNGRPSQDGDILFQCPRLI